MKLDIAMAVINVQDFFLKPKELKRWPALDNPNNPIVDQPTFCFYLGDMFCHTTETHFLIGIDHSGTFQPDLNLLLDQLEAQQEEFGLNLSAPVLFFNNNEIKDTTIQEVLNEIRAL